MDSLLDQVADIRLLIDNGDLEHAHRLGQELLEAFPNSGPVHAVMGDIAVARRARREAIDWYEMAERLGHDPAVAARLERQRELEAAEEEAQIDELLEPRRDNRRLLMAGIVGGFVVVALLVWAIAASVPRQRPPGAAPRPGQPSRIPARPGTAAAPTTALPQTTPTPATGAGGRPATSALPRTAPSTTATGPDASGRPINITQSVDAPMSNRDRLLTRGLAGMTWPTGEALSWRVQAVVDDYTGYVMITVELPPGLRTNDLPGTVIDMAYKLAVATVQADKGVQSLTVRLLTDVDVDNKRISLLAFRGNTTREHLEYYLKRNIQPDRDTIWSHVFATTWWNPSVPTAPTPEG